MGCHRLIKNCLETSKHLVVGRASVPAGRLAGTEARPTFIFIFFGGAGFPACAVGAARESLPPMEKCPQSGPEPLYYAKLYGSAKIAQTNFILMNFLVAQPGKAAPPIEKLFVMISP